MSRTAGPKSPDDEYDLIVVGSGNGACAFLSECLDNVSENAKILVLEQGQNYFDTSNVSHEKGWSKTYSTGSIYKLHNTSTSNGKPVLSGRAVTMGGGGSINYTMIHESNKWLVKNIGQDEAYWQKKKHELNEKFKRDDPYETDSESSQRLQNIFTSGISSDDDIALYRPTSPKYLTENIPSYQDGLEKQLYIFPTQFNLFGQRTNSGVSLVPWNDKRIHLKTFSKVNELVMTGKKCTSVKVENLKSNKIEEFKLSPKESSKIILSGGSQSPRLLMKLKKSLQNNDIGEHVNDHICMPLAIYIVPKDVNVGPKDNYESLFATYEWKKPNVDSKEKDETDTVVCNFDFFSGKVDRLVFLASSLYLTYIPLNWFKRLMARFPVIFTILSNSIRVLLILVTFLLNRIVDIWDLIRFKPVGTTSIVLTTALVKFNARREGRYEERGNKIILRFFEDEQDFAVAQDAIKKHLPFLSKTGKTPFFLLRWIFQLITKIPYRESQVNRYVKNFSERTLLSEQHLAGGCLFGKAIDSGVENPSNTGKVFGTDNIHVADLSTVPLPRVSSQMTAYLVGHYVGNQLYAS